MWSPDCLTEGLTQVASLEGEVNKLDEKKQGLSSELAKGKETGSYQSMYV